MSVTHRVAKALSAGLLFLSITATASAQVSGEANTQAEKEKTKSPSTPFRNERLKRSEDKDSPIDTFHNTRVIVDGMWVPESKDPAKEIVFPEQVEIICTHSEMTCEEMKVILGPMTGVVFIDSIDQTIWPITSWDDHGLLASYGPEISKSVASERCNRHVLAMTFASGAVSTSDIPTHEKGCEPFTETNSFRLTRGVYYVDTTPGNDGDRPYKSKSAK